ncbi:MAG TPA: hypothetical protein VKE69_10085, partial [Planctomycetota bacterium]|nr:hypothetical protein [Planctomycetota bacterium]
MRAFLLLIALDAIAQSASYRLDDLALSDGGGVAASASSVAFVDLPGIAGEEIASASYRASIGFAGAWNAQPSAGDAGGLSSFGTGSPGCAGPQILGASSPPILGNAAFRLVCAAAPPSALGLGLVASAPDVAGHDLFGVGVLLHVDLLLSTTLLPVDFASDATGL